MAKAKNEVNAGTDDAAIVESDVIRYIGEGTYVPGIPARNLSGAEWDELPAATRQALLAQNLYVLPNGVESPAVEDAIAPASAAPMAE